jgi:ribulose-phosphate 3-epimerase
MSVLHPEISKKTNFFLYRYRFLLLYILIGFLSILLEVLCYQGLERVAITPPFSNLLGLIVGILLAFWLNVRYNFKIPSGKRNRAFVCFIIISTISVLLNYFFKKEFEQMGFSYAQARFISAGVLFLIGYALHRKYSFRDFKKVSVAIYANGVEDIESIHKRVGSFPDIIHVDILDHTFNKENHETRVYRLEVIKAYWPNKELQVHIMSKQPINWIKEVASYADLIIFHYECDEDISAVIKEIKTHQCRVGLALMMDTDIDVAKPYLSDINHLMLLTIATPGHSGQSFDSRALKKIDALNHWSKRSSFDICIDGGVNETNIGLLNVEIVVSGSSVLSHANPPLQIMRLQTSSNYESV